MVGAVDGKWGLGFADSAATGRASAGTGCVRWCANLARTVLLDSLVNLASRSFLTVFSLPIFKYWIRGNRSKIMRFDSNANNAFQASKNRYQQCHAMGHVCMGNSVMMRGHFHWLLCGGISEVYFGNSLEVPLFCRAIRIYLWAIGRWGIVSPKIYKFTNFKNTAVLVVGTWRAISCVRDLYNVPRSRWLVRVAYRTASGYSHALL